MEFNHKNSFMATAHTTLPTDPEANATLLDRVKANQRLLTGVLAAIGLIVLSTWFVIESGRRREAAASSLLEAAWSAQDQGNLPQASSDFQRVIDTYGGTDAAKQAALALNQVRIESGQSQLAHDDLQNFLTQSPGPEFTAPANQLLGVALENLNKPADAAAAYQRAAELATTDHIAAEALLAGARAFRAAGDRDAAVRLLRELLDKYPETLVATEAKVRLGELTKGAM